MKDINSFNPLNANLRSVEELQQMIKPDNEKPKIDFAQDCQIKAAKLIERYLGDLSVDDRNSAMMALTNLVIVTLHAAILNSDKLTVQRIITDLKKTVAEMPAPGQAVNLDK